MIKVLEVMHQNVKEEYTMDINIPVSCKIPPEREIAVDLNVIMDYMSVTPQMLASLLLIDEDVMIRARNQKNDEIDIHLLSMLYLFANENLEKNSIGQINTDEQLNKITCFRRLKNACKQEITKRSKKSSIVPTWV